MTIPCKALLLLHVYIMNDNHDYTDVHKLRSKPIGKLVGILTDFQTIVKKKMKKSAFLAIPVKLPSTPSGGRRLTEADC